MPAILLLTWFMTDALRFPVEQTLPIRKVSHFMMLTQVYLNGQGPFQMLLDTGAASSAVRPEVAAKIGVKAEYRVEHMTAAGSGWTVAGRITVQAGDVTDQGVEVLVSPLALPEADGVLGQSWLTRHAYLLDFARQRFVLDGSAPEGGLRFGWREREGRPCVTAQVDGAEQDLVLDSGAELLLLFRPHRFPDRATLSTHLGPVEAGRGRAVLSLGRLRRRLDAVEVPRMERAGLLPASLFRAVYVAKNAGLIVLLPR